MSVPINAADLDDAREALRCAGRDDAEFTFEYVPYPRLGCASGPPIAEVIVTNLGTGVTRIYAAGRRPEWDVEQQAFWPRAAEDPASTSPASRKG
jgi:hypothetical protein